MENKKLYTKPEITVEEVKIEDVMNGSGVFGQGPNDYWFGGEEEGLI